jgi:hypothetical protein
MYSKKRKSYSPIKVNGVFIFKFSINRVGKKISFNVIDPKTITDSIKRIVFSLP